MQLIVLMCHIKVDVCQRGKKRRLGLRASNRPQNSEEKKIENTPGVNSSQLNNSNGQAEDSMTKGGSMISVPQCHTSGSEKESLTKVKSKPVVVESNSNQLLEVEKTPNSDQNPKSEEEKDSGKDDQPKTKLRRLCGTNEVAQVDIDIVENSEQISKASKAGVGDQKMGKSVQKKSSSGNLLSFVTKMKFDTTKSNFNSDSDPFKQDDFDVDFDLDI